MQKQSTVSNANDSNPMIDPFTANDSSIAPTASPTPCLDNPFGNATSYPPNPPMSSVFEFFTFHAECMLCAWITAQDLQKPDLDDLSKAVLIFQRVKKMRDDQISRRSKIADPQDDCHAPDSTGTLDTTDAPGSADSDPAHTPDPLDTPIPADAPDAMDIPIIPIEPLPLVAATRDFLNQFPDRKLPASIAAPQHSQPFYKDPSPLSALLPPLSGEKSTPLPPLADLDNLLKQARALARGYSSKKKSKSHNRAMRSIASPSIAQGA